MKNVVDDHVAESFPCLPTNLRFEYRNDIGRCVYSNTSFVPGDTILSNMPFAKKLLHETVSNRCSYCFSQSNNLLQCSRCHYVKCKIYL
jgi:hypothetical protein